MDENRMDFLDKKKMKIQRRCQKNIVKSKKDRFLGLFL